MEIKPNSVKLTKEEITQACCEYLRSIGVMVPGTTLSCEVIAFMGIEGVRMRDTSLQSITLSSDE